MGVALVRKFNPLVLIMIPVVMALFVSFIVFSILEAIASIFKKKKRWKS